MTKASFVFLSGPRSLFNPRRIADDLQDDLAAHGYEISQIWMPFRSISIRKNALHDFLRRNHQKQFHFVMARKTWFEFEGVLSSRKNQVASLSLIQGLNCSTNLSPALFPIHFFEVQKINFFKTPISYHLHQLFCFLFASQSLDYCETLQKPDQKIFDRFLDHSIELAENE